MTTTLLSCLPVVMSERLESQHHKSSATEQLDQVKIQLNPAITSPLGKQFSSSK